jgi:hypothetical protein
MDVTLRGIGILELQPGCQAYTLSTSLIAAENITTNFTNYIPTLNINLDNVIQDIISKQFLCTPLTWCELRAR